MKTTSSLPSAAQVMEDATIEIKEGVKKTALSLRW